MTQLPALTASHSHDPFYVVAILIVITLSGFNKRWSYFDMLSTIMSSVIGLFPRLEIGKLSYAARSISWTIRIWKADKPSVLYTLTSACWTTTTILNRKNLLSRTVFPKDRSADHLKLVLGNFFWGPKRVKFDQKQHFKDQIWFKMVRQVILWSAGKNDGFYGPWVE